MTILNMCASEINTSLEALGCQQRIELTFAEGTVGIQQITRTSVPDRAMVDKVYLLDNLSFNEAVHFLWGVKQAIEFINGNPRQALE